MTMAKPSFTDLNELRIPDPIQQTLLDGQYDGETLALIALSLE